MIVSESNGLLWYLFTQSSIILLAGVVLFSISFYVLWRDKKLKTAINKLAIANLIISLLFILGPIISSTVVEKSITLEVINAIEEKVGLKDAKITLIEKDFKKAIYYGRGINGDEEIKDFIFTKYKTYSYVNEIGNNTLK